MPSAPSPFTDVDHLNVDPAGPIISRNGQSDITPRAGTFELLGQFRQPRHRLAIGLGNYVPDGPGCADVSIHTRSLRMRINIGTTTKGR